MQMEVPDDLILADVYPRQAFIKHERARLGRAAMRRADPSVHRELTHGWLLPYIWSAESFTWGRWAYWLQAAQTRRLPPGPIPRIDWQASLAEPGAWAGTRRMLERSLDAIAPGWGSWSTWRHFNYLLDWVLFGCGHLGTPELPPEPSEGSSDRLYQVFDASALMLCPSDYLGDVPAESQYGHHQGFYPTPHTVAECLALVNFSADQDHRLERVLDPCVGTGRLLLHASNFSMRLFGADVDATLTKACLVNGYLYAPWLVRPLAWLDSATGGPESAAAVDEAIAAAAPQAPFATAEPDPDAWRFVPIRKRRIGPGSTESSLQGVLF